MANVYWYGGTGNWSAYATHWSNNSGDSPHSNHGAAPGTDDNAIFDNLSFVTTTRVVTIDAAADCLDMNWTGALYTPTLTINKALSIYGSLTLISDMVLSNPSVYLVTFKSTATGNTITTAGKDVYSTFNGLAGGWTLQDDFTSIQLLTLTQGSLDFNNKKVTVLGLVSGGTLTRVLTLGTGDITLNGEGPGQTKLNFTSTGITLNSTGSKIILTQTGTGANSFNGAGLAFNNLVITGGSAYIMTIVDSNTLNDFKIDAGRTVKFTNSSNTIVTTFTALGTSGSHIVISNTSSTTHATLTKVGGGVISGCDYIDIQEMTGSPATTWYIGAHSTDTGTTCTEIYLLDKPAVTETSRARIKQADVAKLETVRGRIKKTITPVADTVIDQNLVDGYYIYLSDANKGTAQSFSGIGILKSASFLLFKAGSPTGNAYAKLYAHSGTYGTSSVPGALLATSDAFDVSSLDGTPTVKNLTFSGGNQYQMIQGTKYVITLEYADGTSVNKVNVCTSNITNVHSGNASYLHSSVWYFNTSYDLYFKVYAEITGLVSRARIFQSGFPQKTTSRGRIKIIDNTTKIQLRGKIKWTVSPLETSRGRIKQAGISKLETSRGRIQQIGITKKETSQARLKQEGITKLETSRGRIKQAGTTKTETSRARIKTIDIIKKETSRGRIVQAGISSVASMLAKISPALITYTAIFTSLGRIRVADIPYLILLRGRLQGEGSGILSAQGRVEKAGLEVKETSRARVQQSDVANKFEARARIKTADIQSIILLQARLLKIGEGLIQALGRVKVEENKLAELQARIIQPDISNILTSQARIQILDIPYILTSRGRILEVVNGLIRVGAYIEGTSEKKLTTKARIEIRDINKIISILSKILKSGENITTLQARILKIESALIELQARIQAEGIVAIDAQARIKLEGLIRVLRGRGRIEKIDIEGKISSKSRIQQTEAETLNSLARIEQLRTNLLSLGARLIKIKSKPILLRARISKTESSLLEFKTRLLKSIIKSATIKAKIKWAGIVKKETMRARLQRLGIKTEESRGRIKKLGIIKNETMLGRIKKVGISVLESIRARMSKAGIAKRAIIRGRIKVAGIINNILMRAKIVVELTKIPYCPKLSPFSKKANILSDKTGIYTKLKRDCVC